jgi:hypothetical protein
MKKFDELQNEHQRLLNDVNTLGDATRSLQAIKDYIDKVCTEAEQVSSPRDRDQLRANLRFWASYVYDRTGIYPDTTLRPVASMSPSPVRPLPYSFWTIVAGVVGLVVVALIFVWSQSNLRTPSSGNIIIGTGSSASNVPLTLNVEVLTSGPAPFDVTTWAAKMRLVATGGNGQYIYWINNQRLPDNLGNEYTIEGKNCEPVNVVVGVTSANQTAQQSFTIQSPLASCQK